MAEYPIIKEGEYYLSIETEHFYFDIYKAWNGTGGGAMFRAGSYVKKKGGKKYYLDYELFAEWDYKDKQTAFEEAKTYIFEYIKHLGNELQFAADVVKVIRCKDCKHLDRERFCVRGVDGTGYKVVLPDDFCSYGERRTDDDV